MATNNGLTFDVHEAKHYASELSAAITTELRSTAPGQVHALEHILITLFAGGPCLLRGTPGTAQTLAVDTVDTIARASGLKLSRITCTADTSPGDVLGLTKSGERKSRDGAGQILSNLVHLREIQKTPIETQLAILQAIQEMDCFGELAILPAPCFFVATINPEPSEAFPLSDALADRFLMMIPFPCPAPDVERQVIEAGTTDLANVRQILSSRDVLSIQSMARQVPASKHVIDYAMDLVRATWPDQSTCPDVVKHCVQRGAGPHAATCLIRAAKARALMKGRDAVHSADIRAVLPSVLLHRLRLRQTAIREGITGEHIAEWLIECVLDHGYEEPADLVPELVVIDDAKYLPPTVEPLLPLNTNELSDWPLSSPYTKESPYELRNPA